jgi:hypothetical protein
MPRPFRSLPLVASLLLLLAPAARAGSAVTLESARSDLSELEHLLGDRHSANKDIVTYLDLVFRNARNLKGPDALPDDASDEARKAHEKAVADFEKDRSDFWGDAVDAALDALKEVQARRDEPNAREEVNVRAAELLGASSDLLEGTRERHRLARRIQRVAQRWMKAHYTEGEPAYTAAFSALAGLGDLDGFSWLVDKFMYTRKRPEDVAQLRAAHRALAKFRKVPGDLRLKLVKTMIHTYAGVEALAVQSTTDTSALASRRFWNQIRDVTIPLLQRYAGYPKHENGKALATMQEFMVWFRDHENPHRAPWTDANGQ